MKAMDVNGSIVAIHLQTWMVDIALEFQSIGILKLESMQRCLRMAIGM